MNKNRNAKLNHSTWQAGTDNTSMQQRAYAYERGYRDALKDARKVVGGEEAAKRVANRIRMFLRPLR